MGQSFPDVELMTCEGETVTLDAYRCAHTILLISIGAGWCQPCQEETPALENLSTKLADKGVGIVQILFQDAQAKPATTLFCKNWVDQFSLTMPVLIDPVGNSVEPFGQAAAPMNLIVDREGKVLWQEVGTIPADLEGILLSFLPP